MEREKTPSFCNLCRDSEDRFNLITITLTWAVVPFTSYMTQFASDKVIGGIFENGMILSLFMIAGNTTFFITSRLFPSRKIMVAGFCVNIVVAISFLIVQHSYEGVA